MHRLSREANGYRARMRRITKAGGATYVLNAGGVNP
jgi:hypothetical protein